MHFTNLASAAAVVATVAATNFASDPSQFNGNATCDESSTQRVRVFNRCSYPVYLWSVLSGMGCPKSQAAAIEPGSYYAENYRNPYKGSGVSMKLSKKLFDDDNCEDGVIAQLEYFIDSSATYGANYLDMSYVDCQSKKCPTAQEGYYLKSGNVDGQWAANDVNEICPILSCDSWESCSKCSYVNWDDRQTKSCNANAPLDLYMCGGEAPGEEPYVPQEPQEPSEPTAVPSSSDVVSSSVPEPKTSSTTPEPSSTEAYVQEAAVVTPAPKPKPVNTKVEVVYEYVTKVEYVNAKRHLHGHRHQHFRA